jgi:hypothetical protein
MWRELAWAAIEAEAEAAQIKRGLEPSGDDKWH